MKCSVMEVEESAKTDVLNTGLQKLSRIKSDYVEFCRNYENKTLLLTDQKKVINTLANYLLRPKYANDICQCFPSIFLEILYVAIPIEKLSSGLAYYNKHLRNCIILAQLLPHHPDVLSFALLYLNKNPEAPFDEDAFATATPAKKLRCEVESFTETDKILACYTFLKHNAEFIREKWNWSIFIEKYLEIETSYPKWLALQCIAIVTGMTSITLQSFLKQSFTSDQLIDYELKLHFDAPKTSSSLGNDSCDVTFANAISKNVIAVSNILLPIYDIEKIQMSNIVEVESTKNNLRKIALAIAASKAICLNGPVGAGKTALVEYIVAKTGHVLGESFIKVQLGDQTDSKMLLGTYRCTDIPGEFVWQPGVLTQAVMNGYWILLEDINSASTDVITVLTALLESKSLSVPGFRDSIKIAPGFQLFLTHRSAQSQQTGATLKKTTNTSTLIEKKIFNVNIEPLTEPELIEIVKVNYPQLASISERIINVYLLFSSGMHRRQTSELTFHNQRLISTRDLFKFCDRAIVDYNVKESGLKVLQDGIDIFCCSINSHPLRLSRAIEIGTQLGIIHTVSEFHCTDSKKNVDIVTTSDYKTIRVGRVTLEFPSSDNEEPIKTFSFTKQATSLLERVACSIKNKEPVLLVGETGVGKTSCVQYLASVLNQKLVVINMNQQSDSTDLLGGYKPVDLKFIIGPIRNEFERLFRNHFDLNENAQFLQNISKCFNANKFSALIQGMMHSQAAAVKNLTKRKHRHSEIQEWINLGTKLHKLKLQIQNQSTFAFAFVEGSLVKALEKGYWVLLDEINLATAETLECLSGLLEGTHGSINLIERGDTKMLKRDTNFTLFACMNPATDVGKKDLPSGLRNRFTEFFVDELTEKIDLIQLVNTYLSTYTQTVKPTEVENIVKFYLTLRNKSEVQLQSGTGQKPHFSLRTLCRALSISARNPCGGIHRSLYEAFCLSFLTQLDAKSRTIVEALLSKALFTTHKKDAVLKQTLQPPKSRGKFVTLYGYHITQGPLEPKVPEDYILTETVKRNLLDIVRIVSIGQLPILIQGDTSVGKTSMITYMAKATGNKCLRINNHEHTDLQEYVGFYAADEAGKLVFQEGLLVEAMRQGYWIILDELNLAPTDVLEALNRVLDDNRELFIPETQTTIKAHPNFMLFATQNPPGLYGGRKVLSRAFRNRFVELHFDEIPPAELETILQQRCKIPASYSKKMVAVMTYLQLKRRNSAAFAGKQGFITLRDLFRWGERYRLANVNESGFYDWDQHLADEGYLLLAGKVRNAGERKDIIEAIKIKMKKTVCEDLLFNLCLDTSLVTKDILTRLNFTKDSPKFKNIVWTYNMRKLAVMVSKSIQFNEPVLLVGNTGGGKTTVCQLLAEMNNQQLHTVNCHLHTESSDFIGGLRPVREHSATKLFEWVNGPLIKAMQSGDLFLADEISLADDSVLERLNSLLEPERTLLLAEKGTSTDDLIITANPKFNFVSTMNPGGDFGKKELSPALRNRFTEIWCDTQRIREDYIAIINKNIGPIFGNTSVGKTYGDVILDFIEFFESNQIGSRITISIRDILTWVSFMNACLKNKIPVSDAYYHGCKMTFLDGLGCAATNNESNENLDKFQNSCLAFINSQLNSVYLPIIDETHFQYRKLVVIPVHDVHFFGIRPFYIQRGPNPFSIDNSFTFNAPSIARNTMRLLRAMQLNKAILLEGSPGVGKTSLVQAVAKASGHNLLRINLSDQTDISDLFGSDLPVEGGRGGEFSWRDGPFLRALKNGDWILLDELNLASQSVLEGLNACLDHRGEIFIPELGKTFDIGNGTRLFGCQNPLRQGGSRKGLPQSFLNRFVQVYIAPLSKNDLKCIAVQQYTDLSKQYVESMVDFVMSICTTMRTNRTFGVKGSPWEFNLRDIQRACEALIEFKLIKPDFYDDNWKDYTISSKIRHAGDRLIQELTKKPSFDIEAKHREIKYLLTHAPKPTACEITCSHTTPHDSSLTSEEGSPEKPRQLDVTSDLVIENPMRLLKLLFMDRMRTDVDKNIIFLLFRKIFPQLPMLDLEQIPALYLTSEHLILGDIMVKRDSGVDVNILRQGVDKNFAVLRSQSHVLKSLLMCVKFNWMPILIGDTGSGKTSVVHTFAQLMGKELQVMSVNSEMDTTEILGGFEQVS